MKTCRYNKVLRSTNRYFVIGCGRLIDDVKCKRFNKIT